MSHIWTLLMYTIKHAIKRNETYHLNIRLGQSFYRKSLKTDSPSICRAYISDIVCFIKSKAILGNAVTKEELDDFIKVLISNRANELGRLGKAITQPFSVTAQHYYETWYKRHEAVIMSFYRYEDTGYPVPEEVKSKYISYKEWMSKQLIKASKKAHPVEHIAKYDNENAEWEITNLELYDALDYPSVFKEKASYLDQQLKEHAQRLASANSRDHSIKFRMELEELYKKFEIPLPTIPSDTPKLKTQSTAPLVTDLESLVREYWDKKAGLSNKSTINKYKGILKDILIYFDKVHVDEISFHDLEEFWLVYPTLPKLNISAAMRKQYGFFSSTKGSNEERKLRLAIIDQDEIEINKEHLYGYEMIKSLKVVLKDFFKICLKNNYITINPIENAELTTPRNKRVLKRTPLSNEKTLEIVRHCFSNLDDLYSWPVLVMAYHGMRNKEVAALIKEDVIKDEDTQVWYFNIKEGKTVNATRKVPIHKEFINRGFIDYWTNIQSNEPLFALTSSMLTNNFNRYRVKFDIPSLNQAGELQSLYSLRHGVISMFQDESNEMKYKVFGHGNNSVTVNYTNTNLELAQFLINKIHYE